MSCHYVVPLKLILYVNYASVKKKNKERNGSFSLGDLAPAAFVTQQFSFYFFLDINKFLWMVRIGGSTDTGKHIKEHDYYTPTGEFRVDREGSPVLLNCLMYKMCYYRFGQVYTEASE